MTAAISKVTSFQSGTPKYRSIATDLAQAILNGELAAGQKLPPHRVMAKRLGVTTGTISRAYACLEEQALAQARVGDGTYVRTLDHSATGSARDSSVVVIDMAQNVAIPTSEAAALLRALTALAQSEAHVGEVLQYQPEAGAQRHRQAGSQWLRRFGTSGAWNRVMVTHGAQHAIAGVLRTVMRPGDTLLTESLSYPGMLALARSMRLQVIGVEMDDLGLLPDALDRAAQTFSSRMLFCSPTLHNPTGSTMSMERREAIAAVVKRRNLLLMEDAVHAAAVPHPLPALCTLVPEQSFLISSFSKVMAPGLRVGYLEASPQWLDKVAASIRADCWMVAPLMPEIATIWLETGEAENLIGLQREAIAERLIEARRLFGGIDVRSAEHYPHLWLPLPEGWRAGPYAAALRQGGVLVRTMDHFAVGRTLTPHAVRISLNRPTSMAQLRLGLQTVVAVLNNPPAALMDP